MTLAFYADSNDIASPDRLLATLARARAGACLVPCESLPYQGPHGPITPRTPLPKLAALCDRLRAAGIKPIVYTFPAVDGDLVDALAHFRAACVACACDGQLDAEPHGGHHWSPALLAPWLPYCASITTTRWEAPHLGAVSAPVWMQAERRGSVAALVPHLTPTDVVVVGDFSRPGEPATLETLRADLALAAAQAKRTGLLGVWSAHTTDDAEADALAAWSAATWPSA